MTRTKMIVELEDILEDCFMFERVKRVILSSWEMNTKSLVL